MLGRGGLPGRVIVQSYNPENFSIQCAREQNYDKFFQTEILLRKQLRYPPFCDVILINFNSLSEKEIRDVSLWFFNYLKANLSQQMFKVFNPMPSPIDKIQNRLRYRIIVKGVMNDEANVVLTNALKEMYDRNLKTTRITVDVNPNNMI